MNYEELLAKIKTVIELTDYYDQYLKGAPINWDMPLAGLVALLKVVELHKLGNAYSACKCCEFGKPFVCPTIQAIEKELA